MASAQNEKRITSNEAVNQPQNGAQVTMNNNIQSMMTLDRFVNWSGIPVGGSIPSRILADNYAMFTHVKGASSGSKAAVVYTGKNACNIDCAWVFAWDAPAHTSVSPNKIYVVCGYKSEIDNMDFNQIFKKLEATSSCEADYTDLASKTSIHGNINSDKVLASVAVKFNLIP